MSNRPSLRTCLIASILAVVSAAAVTPSQACEVVTVISAPTTLNTPVECVVVLSEGPIEGDITNNVQIGNAGGDFAVSVVATTVTGRFFNNGLIIQDGPTPSNVSFATYDGANIAGGIVNNGTIRSTTGIGMSLGILLGFQTPSPVTQTGAIDNFGIIDGGLVGFDGIAGSFLNRLWNHQGATISGGVSGIVTEATFALWTGGILNDGTISGGTGNGINLGQFNTLPLTFTGGITNSATGSIIGGGASAIAVVNTQFSGGIANQGLISGFTRGITLETSQFTGGINNSTTGQILGNTFGILINGGTFADGIDNTGRIAGATERGISVANSVTAFSGDIVNRAGGLIEGANGGLETRALDWLGNLSNAGTIRANAIGDGVLINNSAGSWGGSVLNDGLMQGGAVAPTFDTAGLRLDLATWNGGLTNHGTITSEFSGLFVAADVWNGGIDNAGTIGGGSALAGAFIQSFALNGNILNRSGGVFEGALSGIQLCGGSCFFNANPIEFFTTLTNAGRITKTTVAQDGGFPYAALLIFAKGWSGDIVNDVGGVISAPMIAVSMMKEHAQFGEGFLTLPTDVFTGDFINRGTIAGTVDLRIAQWNGNFNNTGTVSAATSEAVLINNPLGTWDGGIVNDGTIQGGVGPDVLGQAALHVDLAFWNGGILNRGFINSGATGVLAAADVWNGNFDNSGLILGSAGVAIGSDTFTGNILNSSPNAVMRGNLFGLGICHADCQEESEQTGVDFVGSLINSGDISKRDVTLDGGQPLGALTIFANTWTGDIVNEATGVIRAPTLAVPTFAVTMTKQNSFLGEGVVPLPVATFNGNFINRGEIRATVDLRVANWTGNFDNSGSMTAFFPGSPALKFTGGINGFFLNSGAITGPVALDLSGTTSTATYRQTGATARTNGNILLSTTAATTLDFRGGQLTGNVIGAGGDDIFQVNAGAAGFAYLQGTLSNLASLSVNSGTAIFGSSAVGVNGSGVTMTNTGALSVGPGAVLYLDDNTSISTTSLSLTPTSTLAAFLTTNTAQHGSIAVSSGATLAGAFVAHLDPLSFAGTTGTSFQYNGLISGPTTGTFSSVTIAGPPSLFSITPIYGSFSVLVTRTPFDELADEGSPNQENVGSAIEEIYQEGTSDPDLLNLIDTIAEDPDAAGDLYDAIAGATQAETDFAAAKAGDPWKQSVAQRVDAARSTGCTVTGDSWCRTRYAQVTAAPVQTDAGEDPDAFAWLDEGLRDVGATSVWGRVVGILGESDGGVSSPASNHRTYGLIAGADHVVDGTLLVGIAGQYVRTKADFDGSENESSLESIQAGAYFSYGAETYLNGNASVIVSHASTKRIFSVGAIDYLAEVRYPSTSFTGSLDLGRIFEVGNGYRIEPHAGLHVVAQFTDAYAEHGAGGLGLIVDPQDVHSLRSMIGARASRVFDLGDRKMVPELRVEWRHEYLDRNTTFLAAFQGAPDATFLVECEPVARDVVVVGGALTLPLAGRITGYLDAEGAFSEDTRAGTISLGARATW